MYSEGGAELEIGTRVDLHLHSRASGATTSWWVKGLGPDVDVQESYTPPEESYRMAKKAGMDFVTLTDHETIDGALTLLHHPDFFIGEEVSTFFPEDGNQVDVLVYGLDREVHREAQSRRRNLYDLVDYLRETGVAHVLAHPIYGMPGDLDRGQVEKRLVLFGLWEFINGARPARQNRLAEEIAGSVGPLELRQLAARHGLRIPPHRRIAGTAGSDDHGGIFGGSTYTVAPKVGSAAEFLEALSAGEVRPAGEDGSVTKFTHTGFRIAGEAIKKGESDRGEGALRRLVAMSPPLPGLRRFGRPTPALSGKLMEQVPRLSRLDGSAIRSALVSRYEGRLAGALEGMGSGFPLVDFLGSTGDLMDGHMFVAPYVGVHGYFGRENRKALSLRREVFPERLEDLRVGIFVDGLDAVHGVATMYSNIQSLSSEERGYSLRIVRCGEVPPASATANTTSSVRSLPPVTTLPVPLYDGLTLGVPSLLDVLDHVAEEDYNVLHVAAPGPLGLAALVAGLTLGIPVVGAYHTEFGAYAGALSGDAMAAEIVEVAVREFYERCAAVAVPSEATALALRNRGYHIRRFEVLKNGVDRELFNPGRRDEELRKSLGGGGGGARTLMLYAGRVSREKGLERLADIYMDLRRRRDDVHLVIAGDGPYREKLEAMLGDTATFTGFLRGEELARTFASCDVFVFPSATDTLGRAVAEAQASGLPAVVYGIGGPRECIRPGVSGFVVDPEDDEEFFARVEELVEDPAKRERMSHEAREFAEGLDWQAVLEGLFSLYAHVAGLRPKLQTDLAAANKTLS